MELSAGRLDPYLRVVAAVEHSGAVFVHFSGEVRPGEPADVQVICAAVQSVLGPVSNLYCSAVPLHRLTVVRLVAGMSGILRVGADAGGEVCTGMGVICVDFMVFLEVCGEVRG